MIIYEDNTGYIKGYLREDGYHWISEFLLYPEFRGRGLARKLASHIPPRAKLLAYPLMGQPGEKLALEHLIEFYKSIGFTALRNVCGACDMTRN
jgi:GNAT superfamily N-acetyltransferase